MSVLNLNFHYTLVSCNFEIRCNIQMIVQSQVENIYTTYKQIQDFFKVL